MEQVQHPGWVIYMNWDGFAYEWYRLANQAGRATPNLNALIRDGVLFTKAHTGVPAITGAMQQAIAAGAWPADTGNCYKYYNKNENKVIQFGRNNRLENLAEAASRHAVSAASVNAWYFENRGAFAGDERHPYITADHPSNFTKRVDELIKVIHGESIVSGERELLFDEVPRLLSIYADDLDAAGHNGKLTYESLQVADEVSSWYDNIVETAVLMDADLGRLITVLKKRGIFDQTAFVLAADHGMVNYGSTQRYVDRDAYPDSAYTSLYDLAETISETVAEHGYQVEVLPAGGMEAKQETDIVLVPVNLQVQVTFRHDTAAEMSEPIVQALKSKLYYGTHLVKEDLICRGAATDYADLVISAKPPYHFKPDAPDQVRLVGGNHDTLHEQSQHVFLMMSGAGVQRGIIYDEPVGIIDIAPSLARLLGFEGPADAVGTALDVALKEPLRGPKLCLSPVLDEGVSKEIALEEAVQVDDAMQSAAVSDVAGLNADSRSKPAGEDEGSTYDWLNNATARFTSDDENITIAGTTAAGAALRLNKQACGSADEQGQFEIAASLQPGMNRLVVEAEHGGRKTRKILYLEYVKRK